MSDIMDLYTKNFGFGCMRLPLLDNGDIDIEQTKQMVDYFMQNGFNYFDTAHGYLSERSEGAVKLALTTRYDRSKYFLVNKLTGVYFNSNEEIRPLLDKQLSLCGTDYFDLYLMHAQTEQIFKKFKSCRAYETAYELKQEGKVKHIGLSFHDKAQVLDQILTEYPFIEVVQIQLNYLDYDDPSIEGKKVYEVCVKHNKPVIVMEPIKGGSLVNLPKEAKQVLTDLNSGSLASFALRYVAGFKNVKMILSGMSNFDQMKDNVKTMKDFTPLNSIEMEAIKKVCQIVKSKDLIACTNCKYCVDGCPSKILIPDLFACLNAKKQFDSFNSSYYYNIHTASNGKASSCIKCGKCEKVCPQHLNIRELLKITADVFEKN